MARKPPVAVELELRVTADAGDGGRSSRRRLGSVWLFVAALVPAAAALWALVLPELEPAPIVSTRVPWAALALAFYLGEAYVIHLQRCPETRTISLGEAALVLGLYLLSPAGLLGAVLVGAAGALVLVRRQRAAKLVFNLAHLTITTGIALIVFRSVSGLGTRSGSRAGPA